MSNCVGRTQAPDSVEAIRECGGIDLLDAGLRAARRGWGIFPCDGRKKPLVKHWREEATTNETTIRGWAVRWPGAMWARALPADVLLIDLDLKHGRNGVREFKLLQGCDPEQFEAPRVRTGTGGIHIYTDGTGRDFKNSVSKIAPGIDTKTVGGYCIIPSGDGSYRWETNPGIELPPAPQWTEVTLRENTDFECLAEARAFQGCSPYGNAILASACEAITTAPNGKQETTLNNRSYQVGRYVGGGLIERDTAMGSLMAAALGMPDYDEDEKWAEKDIHFKVTRAVQNGMRQPLDGEEPFRAMKEVHRQYDENPQLHEDMIELLTALDAQRDAGDCEGDYAPEADSPGEQKQSRAETQGGEAPNKTEEPWLQPGETRLIRRMGHGLPPPVPFLVDGLFHEVGTGIIAAKYSGGKTFVGMALAASVANEDQHFAGREVLRHGAVLWLAAEGEREVDKRIRAAATALGCDPDKQPIYVQTAGVPKLLAQGGEAAVMKIVRQAQRAAKAEFGLPLVLIVFDTMIKSAGYRKSESDAVDVNAVIQAMDNISFLAKCFVLTLDHMGKDEVKGARGSSDKPSSVDVYMEIKSRGKRFILDAIKIKGEQGEKQINFELVTADLEDGQQTAVIHWEKWVRPEGAEKSLNGNAQVLYACLRDIIARDGVMRKLLHSDPMRRCVQRGQVFEEFSKRHKGSKRHDVAFDRSWKELVRAKLITTVPNKDGLVEMQDWVYLERE